MQAEIHAIDQARVQVGELGLRLRTAAGKANAFPNLVEPARVAAIAGDEILATDAQPARDPDVDGVCLGQAAQGGARSSLGSAGSRHWAIEGLTEGRPPTIDRARR